MRASLASLSEDAAVCILGEGHVQLEGDLVYSHEVLGQNRWGLVCGILGVNIGSGSQQRMEELCMAWWLVARRGQPCPPE